MSSTIEILWHPIFAKYQIRKLVVSIRNEVVDNHNNEMLLIHCITTIHNTAAMYNVHIWGYESFKTCLQYELLNMVMECMCVFMCTCVCVYQHVHMFVCGKAFHLCPNVIHCQPKLRDKVRDYEYWPSIQIIFHHGRTYPMFINRRGYIHSSPIRFRDPPPI